MGFMVAAYVIVWVALLLYVVWLGGKSRKLAQEVEALKEAIAGRKEE